MTIGFLFSTTNTYPVIEESFGCDEGVTLNGLVDDKSLAFTTDEKGNVTIRLTLEATKKFVWIVPPIAVGR